MKTQQRQQFCCQSEAKYGAKSKTVKLNRTLVAISILFIAASGIQTLSITFNEYMRQLSHLLDVSASVPAIEKLSFSKCE